MSLINKIDLPVGCDMPEQGGIAGTPKTPKYGCDTPDNGGFVATPKAPKHGCDTPGQGGIAGNPQVTREKMIEMLRTLALLASTSSNNTTVLPAPTYVVPPMVIPEVPGGIMA